MFILEKVGIRELGVYLSGDHIRVVFILERRFYLIGVYIREVFILEW